jgi:hypothetical protein
MKFLISNYSNPWNTEPYYFNGGLNLLEGVSSDIFNNNQSAYDNFDAVNPDIFITHLAHITKDIVSYLSDNKKIQPIINTNWTKLDSINGVCSALLSQNITPIFFGFNDIKVDNAKYFRILPGADTFLKNDTKQYSINKLIFVNKQEEIVDLDGTYHYATINQEVSQYVDMFLPITLLNNIFDNYDEIVFKNSPYVGSQLSFNAIYSGTKVIFDTKDSNDLDKIDNIFKGQKLLSSVKNKHTCLHRVKSLLSQLSLSDLAHKMEDEINKS